MLLILYCKASISGIPMLSSCCPLALMWVPHGLPSHISVSKIFPGLTKTPTCATQTWVANDWDDRVNNNLAFILLGSHGNLKLSKGFVGQILIRVGAKFHLKLQWETSKENSYLSPQKSCSSHDFCIPIYNDSFNSRMCWKKRLDGRCILSILEFSVFSEDTQTFRACKKPPTTEMETTHKKTWY